MKERELPIGYWIKQVDQLLTNGINAIHNTQGIDRTGWQLLHTLHKAPNTTQDELLALMKSFADGAAFDKALEHLTINGWVSSQANRFYLTVSGEAFHANCLQQQIAFREKSMQHIRAEDYETTLKTLQQLVRNLS